MQPQHRREILAGLRRAVVCLAVVAILLLFANWAAASPIDRNTMLFPSYTVPQVLNSTFEHHYQKNTVTLQRRLAQLDDSVDGYCDGNISLGALRRDYSMTMQAWFELSSVVMGPLLEKNTVRQIDFRPLRLNLLQRAIKKQPRGENEMGLIGTPAKGFPALEYMMEQSSFQPGSAECEYAKEVTQEIVRTVNDLQWQMVEVGVEGEENEELIEELGEGIQLYFNQLVGAVHTLGWDRIEKPLLKSKDEAVSAADLPLDDWAAQWLGIEHLLLVSTHDVPEADQDVVPLEAYLRGLGKLDMADALVSHCEAVASAMQSNSTADLTSIEQTVSSLKALKGFLEQEVAKGLKVSIQFSSSDGD